MRRRHRRTLLAAVLTTAAVAVPCAAWWVVGSHAVERDRADLLESVQSGARRQAFRLAERLRGRLEGVIHAESSRPFFEYAYRYQDPQLSCECATWVESPLSRGPVEPMIWTHFEIDRKGELTVPALPPEHVETTGPIPLEQRQASDVLDEAVGVLARAAWRVEERGKDEESPKTAASTAMPRPANPSAAATLLAYGDESVLVEPFRWYTVEIDGAPRLVALRTVRPPDGARIQGFVISTEAVAASLPSDPYRATFRPRGSRLDGVAEGLGLDGADWEVALDAGDVLAGAQARADDLRGHFVRMFLGGSGAAALAALALIGIVRQSEQTARERSRFAASAAHELRTPLTGIRVYGEMLADDLGDPESRKDYARQVASEADRLSRVVSNVLGYSNLERGRVRVQPEPGDPVEALQRSVAQLRPTVEAHGATLTLEVESAPPTLRFDRDALHQIVANLVDNAERYSREATDRDLKIRVKQSDAFLEIAVRDAGPGIPARDRRRLFKAFQRGADPDTCGLGLGLAIVAGLVRAHSGTLRHESNEPEPGATFVVRLPV